ncbi:MAG: hypothetical protein QXT84_04925, partial [Candidatus Bathyarchaeia archaeon]
AEKDSKRLKSKAILQVLAIKKDMEFEDVIRYIVEHVDKDKLEKVVDESFDMLLGLAWKGPQICESLPPRLDMDL